MPPFRSRHGPFYDDGACADRFSGARRTVPKEAAGFTTKIDVIPKDESDAVLAFLYAHCIRPEWTTRFRWEKHSIVLWDNRCSRHRAICDYLPQVRSG